MMDLQALAIEIASQLDGVIRGTGEGSDDAPAGRDIAWIDLQHEREGLRVILRQGYGAEVTRVRASMSVTGVVRNGADHRSMPNFYELTTAAAMSRGARIIAAQIETKIVQPALPMLAQWIEKKAADAAHEAKHAAAIDLIRLRYPTATFRGEEISVYSADSGYLRGRINSDGGLYIDRCSIPNAAALAVLDAILPPAKPIQYERGFSDYAAIRRAAANPAQLASEVTEEEYNEMLGCVPPIYADGVPGFLVGEALTSGDSGTVYANYFVSRDGKHCARYHLLRS